MRGNGKKIGMSAKGARACAEETSSQIGQEMEMAIPIGKKTYGQISKKQMASRIGEENEMTTRPIGARQRQVAKKTLEIGRQWLHGDALRKAQAAARVHLGGSLRVFPR